MALPKSLSIESMLTRAFPDDITLAQARAVFFASDIARELRSQAHFPEKLRLRYLLKPEDTELPDDTTMGEIRKLVKAGRVRIVIDDMGGGVLLDA